MKDQQTFFDFAAAVGLTKHIGGIEATEVLAALCHIGAGKYILDVGCGVGHTPCFLAKKYGCKVVGVDILESMIERSRERAKKEGVSDRVEFRVADAQELPFENELFDAVITESVTAFPEDKQEAVSEYARVTKPGGYVGLNETTWLKYPPPAEIANWAAQDVGANVSPLTASEWVHLLETAELTEIIHKTVNIDIQYESKGILKRYGLGGMLRILGRMLVLYFRNNNYREFVKKMKQNDITPKNLDEYFGYGLYVGRK